MNWLAVTENPAAVTSLFDLPPSLEKIEVMSIYINRDGPTVELALGLHEYPKQPPHRWEQSESNAVTLKLQLLGVVSVKIEGWSSTNIASVSIQRTHGGIEVSALGPTIRLACVCGHIRISGLSGYRQDPLVAP